MLKKLRNNLLRLNIILLAIVVLLSFSIIYIIIWRSMENDITDRMNSVPARMISSAIISDADDPAPEAITEGWGPGRIHISAGPELPVDYSKIFVASIDERRSSIAVFSRVGLEEEDYVNAVTSAIEKGNMSGKVRIAGRAWQYLLARDDANNIVFMDVQDVQNALARILLRMIVVSCFVLVILFLISYYFANRAIRPVEESLIRQRQFVSDASHELKTPLAIINSNAEAMLAESGATVESQRKWLDRIGEESDRMNKLIESLLYLAKSEESTGAEETPMELSEAAEAEINRVEAILFERGISLTFRKSTERIIVKCDAERIKQAILILLDNAVKYTPKDGSVTVETGQYRNFGFLKVTNTGEGIPQSELPRIFDRFYRVDKARTSSSATGVPAGEGTGSGYGLGLSIAKNIVERDRGRISAEAEGGVVTFTIELPLVS